MAESPASTDTLPMQDIASAFEEANDVFEEFVQWPSSPGPTNPAAAAPSNPASKASPILQPSTQAQPFSALMEPIVQHPTPEKSDLGGFQGYSSPKPFNAIEPYSLLTQEQLASNQPLILSDTLQSDIEEILRQPQPKFTQPYQDYRQLNQRYGHFPQEYNQNFRQFLQNDDQSTDPTLGYQDPTYRYQNLTYGYDLTGRGYTEPVQAYGQPVQAYGQPVQAYGQPAQARDDMSIPTVFAQNDPWLSAAPLFSPSRTYHPAHSKQPEASSLSSGTESPQDLLLPQQQIRRSIRKGNVRTARIKGYNPEDHYKPGKIPQDWSCFKFTKYGELQVGKIYNAVQIHRFLFENPRSLTLWVQKNPASSARRYATPTSSRCRFQECVADYNLISQGQIRVCLDQHTNEDPFLSAGYLHSFCLEKFLDFPEICRRLDVRAEDRELPKEPGEKNRMQLDTQREIHLVKDFIRRCRLGMIPSKYPRGNTSNRLHEGTLTHRLAVSKLTSESKAIKAQRELRGNKLSYLTNHLGNLEIETAERRKTRLLEYQNTTKPRRFKPLEADSEEDEHDPEDLALSSESEEEPVSRRNKRAVLKERIESEGDDHDPEDNALSEESEKEPAPRRRKRATLKGKRKRKADNHDSEVNTFLLESDEGPAPKRKRRAAQDLRVQVLHSPVSSTSSDDIFPPKEAKPRSSPYTGIRTSRQRLRKREKAPADNEIDFSDNEEIITPRRTTKRTRAMERRASDTLKRSRSNIPF